MANEVVTTLGGEFSVTLTDLPGSGYLWRLDDVPEGLELLGVERLSEPSSQLVGDPVERRFHFRAEAPGRFALVFRLRRASAVTVAEEHVVGVTVE